MSGRQVQTQACRRVVAANSADLTKPAGPERRRSARSREKSAHGPAPEEKHTRKRSTIGASPLGSQWQTEKSAFFRRTLATGSISNKGQKKTRFVWRNEPRFHFTLPEGLALYSSLRYAFPMTWTEEIKSRFPDWGTDAALLRWPSIHQRLSVGQMVRGGVIARAALLESGSTSASDIRHCYWFQKWKPP